MHFFKNMNPTDFLRLLYQSKCLIGNSSVGIRECSYLGVPVVNIGTRQFGRERGKNVMDVGHSVSDIKSAIERQMVHGKYESDGLYGDGKAGGRIATLLAEASLETQKTLAY
jgi:UDP-N-acetylglucosamine 2-epimerase